jgi:hypothetical protein
MVGPQIIIGLGFIASVLVGIVTSRILLKKTTKD